MYSLCRSLRELHDCGLVLRDVKPSNILLDAYNEPVFADFGISQIISTHQQVNDTSIKGSYAYMAPEAFEGQGIGKPVDIWSMGCVMTEMLTGSAPFNGMRPQQISRAVCDRKEVPSVPEDAPVRELLMRCFQFSPHDRPTATELVDAFGEFAPAPPNT